MSDNVTVKLHEIQAKGAVIWGHDHRTLVQPACLEQRSKGRQWGCQQTSGYQLLKLLLVTLFMTLALLNCEDAQLRFSTHRCHVTQKYIAASTSYADSAVVCSEGML